MHFHGGQMELCLYVQAAEVGNEEHFLLFELDGMGAWEEDVHCAGGRIELDIFGTNFDTISGQETGVGHERFEQLLRIAGVDGIVTAGGGLRLTDGAITAGRNEAKDGDAVITRVRVGSWGRLSGGSLERLADEDGAVPTYDNGNGGQAAHTIAARAAVPGRAVGSARQTGFFGAGQGRGSGLFRFILWIGHSGGRGLDPGRGGEQVVDIGGSPIGGLLIPRLRGAEEGGERYGKA